MHRYCFTDSKCKRKSSWSNNKIKHIKEKIRQQLQVLRDKGLIEFLGNGHYRKVGSL